MYKTAALAGNVVQQLLSSLETGLVVSHIVEIIAELTVGIATLCSLVSRLPSFWLAIRADQLDPSNDSAVGNTTGHLSIYSDRHDR